MSVAEVVAVSDRRGVHAFPRTAEQRLAVERQLDRIADSIADLRVEQAQNRADIMTEIASIKAEQRSLREAVTSLGHQADAFGKQQGADTRTLSSIISDRRMVIVFARVFWWVVAGVGTVVGFFFGRDIRDAVMRWVGHG